MADNTNNEIPFKPLTFIKYKENIRKYTNSFYRTYDTENYCFNSEHCRDQNMFPTIDADKTKELIYILEVCKPPNSFQWNLSEKDYGYRYVILRVLTKQHTGYIGIYYKNFDLFEKIA